MKENGGYVAGTCIFGSFGRDEQVTFQTALQSSALSLPSALRCTSHNCEVVTGDVPEGTVSTSHQPCNVAQV